MQSGGGTLGPLPLRILAAGVEERDAADTAITEAIRQARLAGERCSYVAASAASSRSKLIALSAMH
jgi:hypothetical protein